MGDNKKPKCSACGSPCEAVLFLTVEGCENPSCKFFGGREVLDAMAVARRLWREPYFTVNPRMAV